MDFNESKGEWFRWDMTSNVPVEYLDCQSWLISVFVIFKFTHIHTQTHTHTHTHAQTHVRTEERSAGCRTACTPWWERSDHRRCTRRPVGRCSRGGRSASSSWSHVAVRRDVTAKHHLRCASDSHCYYYYYYCCCCCCCCYCYFSFLFIRASFPDLLYTVSQKLSAFGLL